MRRLQGTSTRKCATHVDWNMCQVNDAPAIRNCLVFRIFASSELPKFFRLTDEPTTMVFIMVVLGCYCTVFIVPVQQIVIPRKF